MARSLVRLSLQPNTSSIPANRAPPLASTLLRPLREDRRYPWSVSHSHKKLHCVAELRQRVGQYAARQFCSFPLGSRCYGSVFGRLDAKAGIKSIGGDAIGKHPRAGRK
ncbi:hypothetical protein IG631_10113 [Alternaria alternata]|nr:hypothetical protein IG631_10113 [Alternaria alternata]